ncbi:UNVERIFIED_CONTAM: hypothetical protein GTU68_023684 [Idotea baltica]|nr:hypothetical protein [Idotea baltica]
MVFSLIYVALGGAIGAVMRFCVGLMVPFPFGTLTVNVIGSFAMGLAFVALADRGLERWAPFLMTGVLGGFTTFSAFSLDTYKLVEAGRITAASGYAAASVVLSMIALFAAIGLMRGLS